MSHIDLESNQGEDGHSPICSDESSCEGRADEKKELEREWDEDPCNPYNWPTAWKIQQVLMMGLAAFTT
jgi:hypothetical protein